MQFSAARLARASFVFAFAIASIGVASKAQQSEVPPPPDPGVSGSDTYVATWEDIQEERSKAFATLGIAPQQQALRAQVRNSARKLVQNNLTATRSAEIPDLFIDEIAQLLLSIGYGPGGSPEEPRGRDIDHPFPPRTSCREILLSTITSPCPKTSLWRLLRAFQQHRMRMMV